MDLDIYIDICMFIGVYTHIYIQLLKVDEQWQNHGTVVAGQTAPFPMQVYLDLACVSW